jgi:hypothetical protein
METTMLHTFIKAAKLKCWLGRSDCPPVIKECKALFDKAYTPRNRDDNNIDDACDDILTETLSTDNHTTPCTILLKLHPLAKKSKAVMCAQLQHGGIIYANCATHLGNSLIHFYPQGDRSQPPTPGCIIFFFEHWGEMVFAVQHQLSVHHSIVNPFEPYPHFPAKLYLSCLSENLEIVNIS